MIIYFFYSNILYVSVRGLLEGIQPAGEPEDAPAVAHGGEALHVRVPGLHQGLQQRQRQGQAPEQDTLQRGESSLTLTHYHPT